MEQSSLFNIDKNDDIEEVMKAIKSLRLHVVKEEFYIHDNIKRILIEKGISFRHEYKLGLRNRIDFLTEGCTGIEVKKGKPNKKQLLKQISRYLEFDEINNLIVVVEKSISLPEEINNKRVFLISLNKLWGVAS